MAFTKEELEAMRLADEEIERDFRMSQDDLEFSAYLDRFAKFDNLDGSGQKRAAQRKAYREANKDKVAEYQKAYYEANKDKVAAQRKARRYLSL